MDERSDDTIASRSFHARLDAAVFFCDQAPGSPRGGPVVKEAVWRRGGRSSRVCRLRGWQCQLRCANPVRAHSRFPGHALTPTGVMAIRCKQFHLPDL